MEKVDTQESNNTRKDQEDFFIKTVLKEAAELRRKQKIDENFYHKIAWYGKQDAQSHYVYWVLDEIIRAATAMMRWQEFIWEWEDVKRPEWEEDLGLERAISESVNFEQKLWSRKLSEQLIQVILFSIHNKQAIYRIWLAWESLNKVRSIRQDFKEFDNCNNENIEYQIRSLSEFIKYQIEEDSIGIEEIFFSKTKTIQDILNWDTSDNAPFFISFRKLLILSMEIIDDDNDRILLWPTYHTSYWELSQAIHAWSESANPEINILVLRTELIKIAMLCIRLIIWLYKILWIEKTEGIIALESTFSSEDMEAPRLFKNMNKKDYAVWDLIFAHWDFAEILEVKISRYKYTTFKIQYLGRPPIPEIVIEEMPSRAIQGVILKKDSAKEYFEKHILTSKALNTDFPEMVKELSWNITNNEAYKSLKATFIKIDSELRDVWWLIRMFQK